MYFMKERLAKMKNTVKAFNTTKMEATYKEYTIMEF